MNNTDIYLQWENGKAKKELDNFLDLEINDISEINGKKNSQCSLLNKNRNKIANDCFLPNVNYNENQEGIQSNIQDNTRIFNYDKLKEYYTPEQIAYCNANTRVYSVTDIPAESDTYLWYPIIERGSLTVLSAQGGVGKTTVAAYIASIVERKKEFPVIDDRPVKSDFKTNRVLWISRDQRLKKIRNKLDAHGIGKNGFIVSNKDLTTGKTINGVPNDFDDIRFSYLIRQYEPDLVVIDALSNFIPENRNMNSMSEMTQTLDKVKKIIEEQEIACILIHHENKNDFKSGQNKVAGSGAIVNMADCVLSLIKDPEDECSLIMGVVKANDAPFDLALKFNMDTKEVKTIDNSCNIVSIVDFDSVQEEGFSAFEKKHYGSTNNSKKELAADLMIQCMLDNDGLVSKSQLQAYVKEGGVGYSTLKLAIKEIIKDRYKEIYKMVNGKRIESWFDDEAGKRPLPPGYKYKNKKPVN